MLEYFREGAKGPGFKILIAVIVLSFALFGVESVVNLGGNQSPLVINGEKVSERRVAMAINPQSASSENELVTRLENFIGLTLISQQAETLGLTFADSDLTRAVIAEPAFADIDGLFDEQRFVQTLQFSGYTPSSYTDQLRRQLSAAQLQNAIINSEFAVPREAAIFASLQDQQRSFRYHLVSFDQTAESLVVSDEQVLQYYQNNSNSFAMPERVRVSWVELTLDQLAESLEVSDADALAVFEAEAVRSERRDLSHILFTGADALANAQAAEQRLQQGDDFAVLAAELSQDPGSAKQGGSLGQLMQGVFVPPFEQAALALREQGQVSEPVATDFGVHLIRLDALTSQPADFAAQRDAIITRLARERVRLDFAAAAEQMANIAFTSDNLQELATTFDLSVRESDWFTASQARAGVAAYADARAAAFSDQVRAGENSDVVLINDERAIVLRQLDREDATVQPLEQVRDSIVADLTAQLQREGAREQAESYLASLQAGEPLEIEWQDVADYGRQQFTEDFLLSQFVFSLAPPAAGQATSGVTNMINQGFAVVELLAVSTPDVAETVLAERGAELSMNHASTGFQAWFVDKRSSAKVRNRIF